jgi:translation initiation factor IF-1
MELDKNIGTNIEKKAAITHEGQIIAALGGDRYNVRLSSGTFLQNIAGYGNFAMGDSVIITKQGNVYNILQKTYDINGNISEVTV